MRSQKFISQLCVFSPQHIDIIKRGRSIIVFSRFPVLCFTWSGGCLRRIGCGFERLAHGLLLDFVGRIFWSDGSHKRNLSPGIWAQLG
jgi:hypothetical protein